MGRLGEKEVPVSALTLSFPSLLCESAGALRRLPCPELNGHDSRWVNEAIHTFSPPLLRVARSVEGLNQIVVMCTDPRLQVDVRTVIIKACSLVACATLSKKGYCVTAQCVLVEGGRNGKSITRDLISTPKIIIFWLGECLRNNSRPWFNDCRSIPSKSRGA